MLKYMDLYDKRWGDRYSWQRFSRHRDPLPDMRRAAKDATSKSRRGVNASSPRGAKRTGECKVSNLSPRYESRELATGLGRR
jgi:hypothetical protein